MSFNLRLDAITVGYISFKTERDLRHNPAQVAKNARFGDFDGFYLKANTYQKWESRAKNSHLFNVT